jgi:NAD(P)-dependent dehydrogenase (short-subunit alcohol dehydrogenase family)
MHSSTVRSRVLSGRKALVTGAGRGIGRAIAIGLAGAGASVAVLSRTRAELEETAELAGGALVVPADVGDAEQIHAALATVGDIDILVNNAAVVWPLGPSPAIDPEEWAASLAVNVTALARLTFPLLPAMLERGWGRIVNVSSGVAANPGAMLGANAYATAKAALEAHTLSLAAELDGTGVTLNAFRPGMVDTAMQEWIRAQDPDAIGAQLHERFVGVHERGGLITPEHSAQALLARLEGDETGSVWSVDGVRATGRA